MEHYKAHLGRLPSSESEREAIRIAVRIRPLNKREKSKRDVQVVSKLNPWSIGIQLGPDSATSFQCDGCFEQDIAQTELFQQVGIIDLIESALSGFRSTAFAYGQTGAGKTFSMIGSEGAESFSDGGWQAEGGMGLLPRAIHYIFERIRSSQQSPNAPRYRVRVTCMEIYSEQVFDLLVGEKQRKALSVKEHPQEGFYVEGAKFMACPDEGVALKSISKALLHRRIGSHLMNARSNRSHCMVTMYLDSFANPNDVTGQNLFGALSVVDLAGSERLKETGSVGQTMKEAAHINTSLYTLGKVITAIVKQNQRIPFRDSKLTKLLASSLGGNSKTLMLACVSPAKITVTETMRTLKFAMGVKCIKNKPIAVTRADPQAQTIRELKEEVQKLRLENATLRQSLMTAPAMMMQGQSSSASSLRTGLSFDESTVLHSAPEGSSVLPAVNHNTNVPLQGQPQGWLEPSPKHQHDKEQGIQSPAVVQSPLISPRARNSQGVNADRPSTEGLAAMIQSALDGNGLGSVSSKGGSTTSASIARSQDFEFLTSHANAKNKANRFPGQPQSAKLQSKKSQGSLRQKKKKVQLKTQSKYQKDIFNVYKVNSNDVTSEQLRLHYTKQQQRFNADSLRRRRRLPHQSQSSSALNTPSQATPLSTAPKRRPLSPLAQAGKDSLGLSPPRSQQDASDPGASAFGSPEKWNGGSQPYPHAQNSGSTGPASRRARVLNRHASDLQPITEVPHSRSHSGVDEAFAKDEVHKEGTSQRQESIEDSQARLQFFEKRLVDEIAKGNAPLVAVLEQQIATLRNEMAGRKPPPVTVQTPNQEHTNRFGPEISPLSPKKSKSPSPRARQPSYHTLQNASHVNGSSWQETWSSAHNLLNSAESMQSNDSNQLNPHQRQSQQQQQQYYPQQQRFQMPPGDNNPDYSAPPSHQGDMMMAAPNGMMKNMMGAMNSLHQGATPPSMSKYSFQHQQQQYQQGSLPSRNIQNIPRRQRTFQKKGSSGGKRMTPQEMRDQHKNHRHALMQEHRQRRNDGFMF